MWGTCPASAPASSRSYGSSPRVWGTCFGCRVYAGGSRFIPTCVGNIYNTPRRASPESVHPHVCGEHFWRLRRRRRDNGSSPRVWGTFSSSSSLLLLTRFIPTCVGNIKSQLRPSVCQLGSSPRVWGTCSRPQATHVALAVHPHVCGEHAFWKLWTGLLTVHPHVCGEHETGGMFTRRTSTVHPHVCGEHSSCVFGSYSANGSSPRVWGTSRTWRRRRSSRRFIPTCVGNIAT